MMVEFTIDYPFEARHTPEELARLNLDQLGDPVEQYRTGGSLCASGRHEEGARLFLRAHRRAPQPQLLQLAGIALFKARRFCPALRRFLEALEANPDDPFLRYLTGLAYAVFGLHWHANRHFWRAKQIQPTEPVLQAMSVFFNDEFHPERKFLEPLCVGRGIDVGCGYRKTHPEAIGVDLTPPGTPGAAGNVRGRISVADVCASGDHLPMFRDGELAYVVQRHNLEHYQDCLKALEEWKRVLQPGGVLGMVVPDDEVCDTIRLDATHKHVFTRASLRRLLDLIGGFEVLHLEPLLANWSFLCVARKREGLPAESAAPTYAAVMTEYDCAVLARGAEESRQRGAATDARECEELARRFQANLAAGAGGSLARRLR